VGVLEIAHASKPDCYGLWVVMAVFCVCIGLCLTAELFRLAAGYLEEPQVTKGLPARATVVRRNPLNGYAPKNTSQNKTAFPDKAIIRIRSLSGTGFIREEAATVDTDAVPITQFSRINPLPRFADEAL
jgi:hypothetical protein